MTAANVLLNVTLANYLIVPQVVLLGVAWTLVVEIIFYLLTAVTQFARESPHRIAINLAIITILIWKRGAFGPSFALLAVSAVYLPILTMGQTLYWWLARSRLNAVWGIGYLTASCGIFLLGVQKIQPSFLPVTNSYLISVAYALLLFVGLMHIPLPQRAFVRFLSDTSYSMYLVHGIVGFIVLAALMKTLPLAVAILAAAAASLAASFVTYRLIEVPSQRLGRYLSRSWRPAPARSPAIE